MSIKTQSLKTAEEKAEKTPVKKSAAPKSASKSAKSEVKSAKTEEKTAKTEGKTAKSKAKMAKTQETTTKTALKATKPAKTKADKAKAQTPLEKSIAQSRELALKIAGLLDEKKAQKITLIDISNMSAIADYFIICSARSTTAVKALTEHVDEKLSKDYGIEPKGRDIDPKWAAVDYLGVIMHIFHDETRDFYQLERLWDTGNNIENL